MAVQYMTKKELAKMMRVSEVTIDRWRKIENLPCVKVSKKVLFDYDKIKEWIAARSE